MHASHRSVSVVNDNIESNRRNPLLASLSIEKIFEFLDKCTSIPEIVRLVNNVGEDDTYDGYADSKFFKVKHICDGDIMRILSLRCLPVNFTSLAKYETIEFRQHAGTVEAERTMHWAKFVLNLVWYSIHATEQAIQDLEENKLVFETTIAKSQ
jgi:hypothetical protein